jgi:hypothetical protein
MTVAERLHGLQDALLAIGYVACIVGSVGLVVVAVAAVYLDWRGKEAAGENFFQSLEDEVERIKRRAHGSPRPRVREGAAPARRATDRPGRVSRERSTR